MRVRRLRSGDVRQAAALVLRRPLPLRVGQGRRLRPHLRDDRRGKAAGFFVRRCVGMALACVCEGPRRCSKHRGRASPPTARSTGATTTRRPSAGAAPVMVRSPPNGSIADSLLGAALDVGRGLLSVSGSPQPVVARTLGRRVGRLRAWAPPDSPPPHELLSPGSPTPLEGLRVSPALCEESGPAMAGYPPTTGWWLLTPRHRMVGYPTALGPSLVRPAGGEHGLLGVRVSPRDIACVCVLRERSVRLGAHLFLDRQGDRERAAGRPFMVDCSRQSATV